MSSGIILYHNDADGIISGLICKIVYPEYEMIAIDYETGIPINLCTGRDVILVDYSEPTLTMLPFQDIDMFYKLVKCCKSLEYYDHHRSSEKANYYIKDNFAYPNIGGKIEMTGSCAEIVWKTIFLDKPLPFIVKLLSKTDRFNPDDLNLGYYLEYGIQAYELDYVNELIYDNIVVFDTIIRVGENKYRSIKYPDNCLSYYDIDGIIYCISDSMNYPLKLLKGLSHHVGYLINDKGMILYSDSLDLFSLYGHIQGVTGHKHVIGFNLYCFKGRLTAID